MVGVYFVHLWRCRTTYWLLSVNNKIGSFRCSTQLSGMSNKKPSSNKSIWRDVGSSSIKSSDLSATASFGSAATGTAGTRVDLRVGLEVALYGSRETALTAGLDVEAALMVGRGSEPGRDALESLGAAMEVRGLGGRREAVGGCFPSAVVLLSGRVV